MCAGGASSSSPPRGNRARRRRSVAVTRHHSRHSPGGGGKTYSCCSHFIFRARPRAMRRLRDDQDDHHGDRARGHKTPPSPSPLRWRHRPKHVCGEEDKRESLYSLINNKQYSYFVNISYRASVQVQSNYFVSSTRIKTAVTFRTLPFKCVFQMQHTILYSYYVRVPFTSPSCVARRRIHLFSTLS